MTPLVQQYNYDFDIVGVITQEVFDSTDAFATTGTVGLCPALCAEAAGPVESTLSGVVSEYGVVKSIEDVKEQIQFNGYNMLPENLSANTMNLFDRFEDNKAYFRELRVKSGSENRIAIEEVDAEYPEDFDGDKAKSIRIALDGRRTLATTFKTPTGRSSGGAFNYHKDVPMVASAWETYGSLYNTVEKYSTLLDDGSCGSELWTNGRLLIQRIDVYISTAFSVNRRIYFCTDKNLLSGTFDKILGYFDSGVGVTGWKSITNMESMQTNGYQLLTYPKKIYCVYSGSQTLVGRFEYKVWYDILTYSNNS
ncbi:MAG TPA: hypothetical protein PLA71_00580 [Saccharofermentans sp.]|nr:hypothetical protein [Saccharofermentans sp.]